MLEHLYQIELTGSWDETQIEIDWDPANRKYGRAIDPEFEAAIEQEWQAFLVECPRAFAGLMARYAGHSNTDTGKLSLHLGLTNYRDHIVVNNKHPELRERLGEEYLANGCAVCIVPRTADHKMPLGLRAMYVGEAPGQWHVPGGNLNLAHGFTADRMPSEIETLEAPNPFEMARIELVEELGIKPEQISNLRLIGIMRNAQTFKPELIFTADLAVDEAQLRASIETAEDKDEHTDWLFLEANAEAIRGWCEANADKITPAGAGALEIFCRAIQE